MHRLLALTLFLSILLIASCASENNPTDLIAQEDSPDKRGYRIENPPSDEETYMALVHNSFNEVEWSTEEVEIDRSGGTFYFFPEGYPETHPVVVKIAENEAARGDGDPLDAIMKVMVPLPPATGEYLDVFGDNILFRTKGFSSRTDIQFQLSIPIAPWNNPAGLSQNMCIYDQILIPGYTYPEAVNGRLFTFEEFPPPPETAVYFSVNGVMEIAEPDGFTDSVFDDLILGTD
jgi:hypothetical protein